MSQKFDKDRVICISLKSHNQQQLFSIAEKYLISFEAICEMKNDGFTKIWVESGGRYVIACQHKSYPDDLIIKDNFNPLSKKDHDFLKQLRPVKVPKMPKNQIAKNNYKAFLNEGYDIKTPSMEKTKSESVNRVTENLDLDSILDKIGQCGVNSLTKNEKLFLDNLSKSL